MSFLHKSKILCVFNCSGFILDVEPCCPREVVPLEPLRNCSARMSCENGRYILFLHVTSGLYPLEQGHTGLDQVMGHHQLKNRLRPTLLPMVIESDNWLLSYPL